MDVALSGVRVVDLTGWVAGPYCTKLMADLGAEVLKIECPRGVDPARNRGPFLDDVPHPEMSLLFLNLNTNKLGVTLNLNDKKGRSILRDLVRDADIMVEDKAPGCLAGMGLGYESMRKLNPGLVVCSITAFGQTGRYRDYKAYPFNTFHASGEGYLTPAGDPYPDRPPLNIDSFAGEYSVGIYCALAVVSAFYWQEATGAGQHIDVSRQEALMSISALDVAQYPTIGEVPLRTQRGHVFGGNLPCKDGWVEIGIYGEAHWQALMTVLDNPDWSKDERFKDAPSRARHGKEVNELLTRAIKDMSRWEIYHKGQKLGMPIGIFFTSEDVYKSQQEQARGLFCRLEHPRAGTFDYPTAPYKFSGTPWAARRAAPLLGEHNEDIYSGRMGYSRRDLVRLRGLGII